MVISLSKLLKLETFRLKHLMTKLLLFLGLVIPWWGIWYLMDTFVHSTMRHVDPAACMPKVFLMMKHVANTPLFLWGFVLVALLSSLFYPTSSGRGSLSLLLVGNLVLAFFVLTAVNIIILVSLPALF
jgi:hypothetical protein